MKIRNIVSAAAACAVAAAALVIPTSAEESYVAGITWQSSKFGKMTKDLALITTIENPRRLIG